MIQAFFALKKKKTYHLCQDKFGEQAYGLARHWALPGRTEDKVYVHTAPP